MKNPFGAFCDGLFLDMCVTTQMKLPRQRETVLAFFEQIQKRFPTLHQFSRREQGELILEEEIEGRRFRWVAMESQRLSAGCADPDDFAQAYELQQEVIEIMPYMLGISPLDVESLDVTFTMDFDYQGNHDEVIAEALLGNSSLSSFFEIPGAKVVSCCPTMIAALTPDGTLQTRIAMESRSGLLDRNDKNKIEEPISLYFTVRRYPSGRAEWTNTEAYQQQCRIAEHLMFERIIPHFARPLSNAISQRR
jgi:hypothetical protein